MEGLEGVWSLPAGFVKEDETVDEAVVQRDIGGDRNLHSVRRDGGS